MYYEIEGTQVRLVGSMHLVPASAPNLPDWVWKAYEWCEQIIFEADSARARDHIFMGEGDSLEFHLPAHLWKGLEAEWLPSHPLGQVSRIKWWMAMMALPISRFPTVPGVEPQLTQRAREQNRPISYLETMAEFAELGDGVPLDVACDALAVTLAELPNAQRNFLDLHQAWLSRRIEAVEVVIARTVIDRMPLIAARLLDYRNQKWLPKILGTTSSEKRTLIAVGALHLPRKNGLLDLLGRAGHRVRLVP